MTSLSGMFAVTFSIVFAYVADITTKEDRSAAYGLVCGMAVCIGALQFRKLRGFQYCKKCH